MGSPSGGACPEGNTGAGCKGDGIGLTTMEAGHASNEALHFVQLTHSLELGEVEVTQGSWKLAFDPTPKSPNSGSVFGLPGRCRIES